MSERPSWLKKVEELTSSIAAQEGCFLYDLDFVGAGSGRTLRVFLDKESGAGIEDCSKVSRELNSKLDELDLVPGDEYQLEVSTPGVDRVLRLPWHFEKVIGKKIWLRLFKQLSELGLKAQAMSNAKKFEAPLVACSDGSIQVQIGEEVVTIPFSEVDKAQLVFVFDEAENSKPNLAPKKKKK